MIACLLRLLFGREVAETLLWVRDNPQAVIDDEADAWEYS